jgi:hypothetical protein
MTMLSPIQLERFFCQTLDKMLIHHEAFTGVCDLIFMWGGRFYHVTLLIK